MNFIDFADCSCSGIEEACGCKKDCSYQDYLVHEGFAMSCDDCGHAGSVASDGWIGVVNKEGQCAVFFSRNCAGEENYRIWELAQQID